MDMLSALDCVISEHQRIRGHLKLVGDSLTDREAVDTIEKTKVNMLENISQPLRARFDNALRTLAALKEGLKNHYDFEEAELPPIVGDVLTTAMKLEHKQMLEEIDSAISVVGRTNLDGLSDDQKITEQALVLGLLDRIERAKEQHMREEEMVLNMARTALVVSAERKQLREAKIEAPIVSSETIQSSQKTG